jgi:hypothetical protein
LLASIDGNKEHPPRNLIPIEPVPVWLNDDAELIGI